MPWDYDAWLINQYEHSCGEDEEEELDDDAPEEEDTEDVLEAFNRKQESMAISAGDL